MSSTTTTNTVDPVCGMTIDPRTAIAVVHDRATYYFCETACAETFRDEPERWAKRGFIDQPAGPTSAVHAHDERRTATLGEVPSAQP